MKPKLILIVEDDNLVRGVLASNLTAKGFSVLEAGDGQAGLDAAQAKHPDLIICDVHMPQMDGLAMVEALRSDTATEDIPVIMLTNDEAASSLNRALQNGVTMYLSKTTMEPDLIAEQVAASLGEAPL